MQPSYGRLPPSGTPPVLSSDRPESQARRRWRCGSAQYATPGGSLHRAQSISAVAPRNRLRAPPQHNRRVAPATPRRATRVWRVAAAGAPQTTCGCDFDPPARRRPARTRPRRRTAAPRRAPRAAAAARRAADPKVAESRSRGVQTSCMALPVRRRAAPAPPRERATRGIASATACQRRCRRARADANPPQVCC